MHMPHARASEISKLKLRVSEYRERDERGIEERHGRSMQIGGRSNANRSWKWKLGGRNVGRHGASSGRNPRRQWSPALGESGLLTHALLPDYFPALCGMYRRERQTRLISPTLEMNPPQRSLGQGIFSVPRGRHSEESKYPGRGCFV